MRTRGWACAVWSFGPLLPWVFRIYLEVYLVIWLLKNILLGESN